MSFRRGSALSLFIIATVACSNEPEAPPAPAAVALALDDEADLGPLGAVTPDGACDLASGFAGATCEQYVVSCPGLDDATVRLVIAEPSPAATYRGTVLIGSGSRGVNLYEASALDPATGDNPVVFHFDKLRAKGFRLVQRAWQGDAAADKGWFRGVDGPDAGACRHATLAAWLHDRYADEGGGFCALGFSGGSMELALSMTRWGTGDLLDLAIFESGPVARFDEACLVTPEYTDRCADVAASHPWECGGGTPLLCGLASDIEVLIDGAYGGEPTCAAGDPLDMDMLYGDSALAPDAADAFPSTRLYSVLGMRDCGSGAGSGGADFATRITGLGGAAPTIIDVPDAGHSLHATSHGARELARVIQKSCKPVP